MERYWLVLGSTGSVEGSTRSVQGSKDRKYLGVRSKKSEIGQFGGFLCMVNNPSIKQQHDPRAGLN